MERGMVRLPANSLQSGRRTFGRVVPLTDRFWLAAYRSLQWMDGLPGGGLSDRGAAGGNRPDLMVGESAAAVRLLHVIMLDECGTRRFVKCSTTRSTSRMTRSLFPAIPIRGDLAALNRPAAPRAHGPSPASLTKHDPIFTAAAMRAQRSCIRPTKHIALPDRHPRRALRVNRRAFVMFAD